jgi:hypothetical protein
MKYFSILLAALGFVVLAFNLVFQNWLWVLGGLLFTPYWIMAYFRNIEQEKVLNQLKESLRYPYWIFTPFQGAEIKIISAKDYASAVLIKDHYKFGEGNLTMASDLYIE